MNNHSIWRRYGESLGLVLIGLAASATAVAQPGPDVVHAGIECIPQTQFSILTAAIRPTDEIQTARVYFRSDKYIDFYYVDMAWADGEFRAVLPKPTPETEKVIYYIEAVDVGFSSNRTMEYVSDVVENEDECRRRDPAAAYYTGSNPGIIVGALKAGMPPVPAGFLAEGITGFIPLVGSGGGSGIGAGTAIAIGAGAAGAAGVGVLTAAGSDVSTTTTSIAASPPPPPTTTTAVTTSVPAATPLRACFTTEPDPAVIDVGERIKLDARCSEPAGALLFTWDLGDGRMREGSFIEPSYTSPGTYTVVLTVRRAASLQVLAQNEPEQDTARIQVIVREPGADLAIAKSGSPEPFEPYEGELTYTIKVQNLGPGTATGVTVVDTLSPEMVVVDKGGCLASGPRELRCQIGTLAGGEGAEIQITVRFQFYQQEPPETVENRVEVLSDTEDPNLANNSAVARNTTLSYPQKAPPIELAFTSLLQPAQTDVAQGGYVILNGGRSDATVSGTAFEHHFQARPGTNTIEAYPLSDAGEGGVWRFDFSNTSSFMAGSLRVELGSIVAQDGRTVVFRLSGTAGERIRFSFDLVP